MNNDYSAYLLAKVLIARLHAEARAAHLASVAQTAAGDGRAPHWFSVLRRRHVQAWLTHPAIARADQR